MKFPDYIQSQNISVKSLYGEDEPEIPKDWEAVDFRPAQEDDRYLSPYDRQVRHGAANPGKPFIILVQVPKCRICGEPPDMTEMPVCISCAEKIAEQYQKLARPEKPEIESRQCLKCGVSWTGAHTQTDKCPDKCPECNSKDWFPI